MRAFPGALILLAVAGVSAAGGFWWGRTAAPAPALASRRDTFAARRTAVTARPRPRAAAPSAGATDALAIRADANEAIAPAAGRAETLEPLRLLLEMRKRHLADINTTLIDYDGKLTPAFRELFGLTDAETEALQQAVTRTREQLARYRRENTSVKVRADAIELATAPFASGADLYDQVMDQFTTTLGRERYGAFMELQAQNLQWAFGQFGAQRESVTVTRTAMNDGGVIFMTTTRMQGTNITSSGSGAFRTVDELVKQYPALAPYGAQLAQLPVNARPPKP